MLISETDLAYPDWAVIFLSESDGFHNHEFSIETELGHTMRRHWPGAGANAMSVIIKESWAAKAQKIKLESRSGSVQWKFEDGSLARTVFLHGGHGDELTPSLATAASAVTSCRGAANAILMGDFNVDVLPSTAGDPYHDLPNRANKHLEERLLLKQVLDGLGMELLQPTVAHGFLPDTAYPERTGVPVTRVPIGNQPGQPAILDHAAALHHNRSVVDRSAH